MMQHLQDPITIGLKDSCNERIGLAIIDIDRIKLPGHGQGAIGFDGFYERRMTFLEGKVGDIVVAVFGQEAFFEGSDAIALFFVTLRGHFYSKE